MSYTKRNVRSGYRSTKRYNFSRTNNTYSNKFRSRANFSQLFDKYINLAKEASSIGDRIQAEYYHQLADHYARVMNENGSKPYDKENVKETSINKNTEDANSSNNQEVSKLSSDDNTEPAEKIDIVNEIDENQNSIETVPFISEPVKKTSRQKKKL